MNQRAVAGVIEGKQILSHLALALGHRFGDVQRSIGDARQFFSAVKPEFELRSRIFDVFRELRAEDGQAFVNLAQGLFVFIIQQRTVADKTVIAVLQDRLLLRCQGERVA